MLSFSKFNRLYFSLGLLSLSMIAYQLSLMQYLSIVQWYHFAYMVIAIALLGFGAAGTFIAIFRSFLLRKSDFLLPLFMVLTGISMPFILWLSGQPFARFDTYLLFVERSRLWQLLLYELLFFIPFFFCALAIGLVFVKYTHRIGKLYFSNLVGSGLGGLAAIVLFWTAFPTQIPYITGIISLLAASVIVPLHQKRNWLISIGIAGLLLIIPVFYSPSSLPFSQYKSLSQTLDLPDVKIEASANSPYGWVQYVSSPVLRYAPGLSLSFTGEVPVIDAVFTNGDWAGAVLRSSKDSRILDYTTSAVAWEPGRHKKVLILDAGTGVRTQYAVLRGAAEVDHVEPNGLVSRFSQDNTGFGLSEAVRLYRQDSRSFLAQCEKSYNLISLPPLGAFGGTAGLGALQEEYLLTKNSFSLIFDLLENDGFFEITVWLDYPYRNPLKIVATISETLAENNLAQPEKHLVAVRSWNTLSFLVKKSPFKESEVQAIRNFCDRLYFDPMLLPGITPEERTHYNLLEDHSLFNLTDSLVSGNRERIYENYDFHLRPATDDKPYFSQFLRLKSLPHLQEIFGNQSAFFIELGYLIVGVTFLQSLLLAIVLIILPLFRLKQHLKNKGFTLLYFSGLGMGFMFVEIVLIQRLVLYLGHPVYSVAAVVSGMLLLSGLGSWLSSGVTLSIESIRKIVFLIVSILLIYAGILPWLLQAGMGFSMWAKVPFALVLIGLPSFFMGMPFPMGLQFLSQRNEAGVPWAWGVNGCLSVVSASLATILAIEVGFSMLMLLASAAYLITLASSFLVRKR
ncbi:hypothetical protein FK178_07560 [Antarcticibacterium arcticum]|uniref:Spermidine synthase-like protein n=1 Tax=Antarcticibacterium arcticum TaxID=2585771 RepID=A0A5B8YIY0_9FLAO|nr:hypothetical protein [Antarcticibacterium arcticum]QED37591.1 hypothetical protein FK178_07560 [Antarcticibacterium arcticum]